MKQIIYELKSQPVIAAISVLGTALAIFLIMVVVMLQEVKTAPFAPENNRDRVLHGHYIHLRGINGNDREMSAGTSLAYLKELYGTMPGVSDISYVMNDKQRTDVQLPGGKPYTADLRGVDDVFFKIFDYKILSGKPFDHAASEAGQKVAVVTEAVARALYGSTDIAGREILLGQSPYKVVAVIGDVSKIASNAYGQIFVPYVALGRQNDVWGHPYTGPFEAYLALEPGIDAAQVKEETERRVNSLSSGLSPDQLSIVYHGQPYTEEEYITPHGSNTTPDVESDRKNRYALYLVLLLIPAINLSSMTQSRLRRRVSEIGVRRAFGCTRSRVITDVITENFIVTLAGGIIGLLLSVVFAWLYCNVKTPSYGLVSSVSTVSLPMLLNWTTLLYALAFCFVLNLLSSGIPAWRASRINPVEALSGLNR